jgi:sarcosine oxidase gamma subunit
MAEPITDRLNAPGVALVDGLRMVAVRWLGGGEAVRQAFDDSGLPWASAPGDCAGDDPLVAWCAPRERWLIGQNRPPLDQLLTRLAPGRLAGALAVDVSDSSVVFNLCGTALDTWLAHLVDASAVPRVAWRASRCRLADVPVLLLRRASDRLWLVVDRPLGNYVADWLEYAHEGAFAKPVTVRPPRA